MSDRKTMPPGPVTVVVPTEVREEACDAFLDRAKALEARAAEIRRGVPGRDRLIRKAGQLRGLAALLA